MNVCAVLDHNFCFGNYRCFDRVFQVVEGRRVMLWLGSHSGQVSMLRAIEGLCWLRCLIVIVVVLIAHSSKDTCFKFYILLQGLDGVQVPVRRVLARTDYQAPTCAE